MKFRVETWDTAERGMGWVLSSQGSEPMQMWLDYYINMKGWCTSSIKVRLRQKVWLGWVTILEAYGTKETKPMSTKQRGDVERRTTSEKFHIILDSHGGFVDFDRAQFRRIWEAGEAEFGWENATPIKDENLELRRSLAEKEAEIAKERQRKEQLLRMWSDAQDEIARLKAQAGLHHVGPCSQYAEEVARLRGWMNRWKRSFVDREEMNRALAGEKVPE